ncbi:hypothetical protein Clacol_008413 [Clathrus columnatus]|uniref:Uncharacterized protein n=1 Tax=Clathrus columnatus TaxID=1419009 RepID=A0AAV5AM41_9AGAM|nr:hypothetical protein Clacol_008413 [Clathrus columnatus]
MPMQDTVTSRFCDRETTTKTYGLDTITMPHVPPESFFALGSSSNYSHVIPNSSIDQPCTLPALHNHSRNEFPSALSGLEHAPVVLNAGGSSLAMNNPSLTPRENIPMPVMPNMMSMNPTAILNNSCSDIHSHPARKIHFQSSDNHLVSSTIPTAQPCVQQTAPLVDVLPSTEPGLPPLRPPGPQYDVIECVGSTNRSSIFPAPSNSETITSGSLITSESDLLPSSIAQGTAPSSRSFIQFGMWTNDTAGTRQDVSIPTMEAPAPTVCPSGSSLPIIPSYGTQPLAQETAVATGDYWANINVPSTSSIVPPSIPIGKFPLLDVSGIARREWNVSRTMPPSIEADSSIPVVNHAQEVSHLSSSGYTFTTAPGSRSIKEERNNALDVTQEMIQPPTGVGAISMPEAPIFPSISTPTSRDKPLLMSSLSIGAEIPPVSMSIPQDLTDVPQPVTFALPETIPANISKPSASGSTVPEFVIPVLDVTRPILQSAVPSTVPFPEPISHRDDSDSCSSSTTTSTSSEASLDHEENIECGISSSSWRGTGFGSGRSATASREVISGSEVGVNKHEILEREIVETENVSSPKRKVHFSSLTVGHNVEHGPTSNSSTFDSAEVVSGTGEYSAISVISSNTEDVERVVDYGRGEIKFDSKDAFIEADILDISSGQSIDTKICTGSESAAAFEQTSTSITQDSSGGVRDFSASGVIISEETSETKASVMVMEATSAGERSFSEAIGPTIGSSVDTRMVSSEITRLTEQDNAVTADLSTSGIQDTLVTRIDAESICEETKGDTALQGSSALADETPTAIQVLTQAAVEVVEKVVQGETFTEALIHSVEGLQQSAKMGASESAVADALISKNVVTESTSTQLTSTPRKLSISESCQRESLATTQVSGVLGEDTRRDLEANPIPDDLIKSNDRAVEADMETVLAPESTAGVIAVADETIKKTSVVEEGFTSHTSFFEGTGSTSITTTAGAEIDVGAHDTQAQSITESSTESKSVIEQTTDITTAVAIVGFSDHINVTSESMAGVEQMVTDKSAPPLLIEDGFTSQSITTDFSATERAAKDNVELTTGIDLTTQASTNETTQIVETTLIQSSPPPPILKTITDQANVEAHIVDTVVATTSSTEKNASMNDMSQSTLVHDELVTKSQFEEDKASGENSTPMDSNVIPVSTPPPTVALRTSTRQDVIFKSQSNSNASNLSTQSQIQEAIQRSSSVEQIAGPSEREFIQTGSASVEGSAWTSTMQTASKTVETVGEIESHQQVESHVPSIVILGPSSPVDVVISVPSSSCSSSKSSTTVQNIVEQSTITRENETKSKKLAFDLNTQEIGAQASLTVMSALTSSAVPKDAPYTPASISSPLQYDPPPAYSPARANAVANRSDISSYETNNSVSVNTANTQIETLGVSSLQARSEMIVGHEAETSSAAREEALHVCTSEMVEKASIDNVTVSQQQRATLPRQSSSFSDYVEVSREESEREVISLSDSSDVSVVHVKSAKARSKSSATIKGHQSDRQARGSYPCLDDCCYFTGNQTLVTKHHVEVRIAQSSDISKSVTNVEQTVETTKGKGTYSDPILSEKSTDLFMDITKEKNTNLREKAVTNNVEQNAVVTVPLTNRAPSPQSSSESGKSTPGFLQGLHQDTTYITSASYLTGGKKDLDDSIEELDYVNIYVEQPSSESTPKDILQTRTQSADNLKLTSATEALETMISGSKDDSSTPSPSLNANMKVGVIIEGEERHESNTLALKQDTTEVAVFGAPSSILKSSAHIAVTPVHSEVVTETAEVLTAKDMSTHVKSTSIAATSTTESVKDVFEAAASAELNETYTSAEKHSKVDGTPNASKEISTTGTSDELFSGSIAQSECRENQVNDTTLSLISQTNTESEVAYLTSTKQVAGKLVFQEYKENIADTNLTRLDSSGLEENRSSALATDERREQQSTFIAEDHSNVSSIQENISPSIAVRASSVSEQSNQHRTLNIEYVTASDKNVACEGSYIFYTCRSLSDAAGKRAVVTEGNHEKTKAVISEEASNSDCTKTISLDNNVIEKVQRRDSEKLAQQAQIITQDNLSLSVEKQQSVESVPLEESRLDIPSGVVTKLEGVVETREIMNRLDTNDVVTVSMEENVSRTSETAITGVSMTAVEFSTTQNSIVTEDAHRTTELTTQLEVVGNPDIIAGNSVVQTEVESETSATTSSIINMAEVSDVALENSAGLIIEAETHQSSEEKTAVATSEERVVDNSEPQITITADAPGVTTSNFDIGSLKGVTTEQSSDIQPVDQLEEKEQTVLTFEGVDGALVTPGPEAPGLAEVANGMIHGTESMAAVVENSATTTESSIVQTQVEETLQVSNSISEPAAVNATVEVSNVTVEHPAVLITESEVHQSSESNASVVAVAEEMVTESSDIQVASTTDSEATGVIATSASSLDIESSEPRMTEQNSNINSIEEIEETHQVVVSSETEVHASEALTHLSAEMNVTATGASQPPSIIDTSVIESQTIQAAVVTEERSLVFTSEINSSTTEAITSTVENSSISATHVAGDTETSTIRTTATTEEINSTSEEPSDVHNAVADINIASSSEKEQNETMQEKESAEESHKSVIEIAVQEVAVGGTLVGPAEVDRSVHEGDNPTVFLEPGSETTPVHLDDSQEEKPIMPSRRDSMVTTSEDSIETTATVRQFDRNRSPLNTLLAMASPSKATLTTLNVTAVGSFDAALPEDKEHPLNQSALESTELERHINSDMNLAIPSNGPEEIHDGFMQKFAQYGDFRRNTAPTLDEVPNIDIEPDSASVIDYQDQDDDSALTIDVQTATAFSETASRPVSFYSADDRTVNLYTPTDDGDYASTIFHSGSGSTSRALTSTAEDFYSLTASETGDAASATYISSPSPGSITDRQLVTSPETSPPIPWTPATSIQSASSDQRNKEIAQKTVESYNNTVTSKQESQTTVNQSFTRNEASSSMWSQFDLRGVYRSTVDNKYGTTTNTRTS